VRSTSGKARLCESESRRIGRHSQVPVLLVTALVSTLGNVFVPFIIRQCGFSPTAKFSELPELAAGAVVYIRLITCTVVTGGTCVFSTCRVVFSPYHDGSRLKFLGRPQTPIRCARVRYECAVWQTHHQGHRIRSLGLVVRASSPHRCKVFKACVLKGMTEQVLLNEMQQLVRREALAYNTLVENYRRTRTVPGNDRWTELNRRLCILKKACDGKDVNEAWDHVETLVETWRDLDRWEAAVRVELQKAAAATGSATGLAGTYPLIRCCQSKSSACFRMLMKVTVFRRRFSWSHGKQAVTYGLSQESVNNDVAPLSIGAMSQWAERVCWSSNGVRPGWWLQWWTTSGQKRPLNEEQARDIEAQMEAALAKRGMNTEGCLIVAGRVM